MVEHTNTVEEQLQKHSTNRATGLTNQQAAQLLETFGENKLIAKKHRTWLQKFLDQMKDFMVIILLIAAAVSFIVSLLQGHGEFIDSIVILGIVVINAVLGVQQESKAEKSLDALQDMSAPSAKVLRDGKIETISSHLVVPGDIVMLEAGDFIPADGRILEGASLKCEESALTGESVPVDKYANAVVAEDAALGDRLNMVFSGCAVTYGRATVLVTRTGMDTEMGKIASLLNEAQTEPTPLQIRLDQMGKYLGILVLGICAVIFAIGFFQTDSSLKLLDRFLPSFMTGVSLAVAAIPEGLTAVVTVVLALGVQRMVKENAIVKRLPAVETLGSASVICSDKTGTLTQNKMTVREVWAAGKENESLSGTLTEEALHVIRLGTLCNDGQVDISGEEDVHLGDPTETAIVAAAEHHKLAKIDLDKEFPRLAEIPFDSDRKLMTTIHRVGDKILSITKGGFDVLLPLCTSGDSSRVEEINMEMADDALRVLAVACRELDEVPSQVTPSELEQDLTFIGLIGMIDPPREESKQAILECRQAGIKTVMITGDHIATATAIARELGIIEDGTDQRAITGKELTAMDDKELADNIHKIRVYARVSPEDKIRIVRAWQSRGDVVAMTGDGVNDAPALKASDIGCAMGITGTDVAKDAADMVLTDDNFSTIVTAVKNGRGIYDNIRKTIQFLIGSNLGEVFTVFFAMIFWKSSPLLAIHLLVVNIVTDAFPALALGVEPTESSVMSRKPIPKDQGIFSDGLGLIVVLSGIMVGIITLAAYYIGRFVDISPVVLHNEQVGMTMAFLVLALSQLVHAFNCRSHKSIFTFSLISNSAMIKAFFGSLAVVLLICLVKPLEIIFKMVDLSLAHWGVVALLSLSPIVFSEIAKLVGRLTSKNKKVA